MADSTSESAQQEGKAQGDSMDDPNSTNIDMKTEPTEQEMMNVDSTSGSTTTAPQANQDGDASSKESSVDGKDNTRDLTDDATPTSNKEEKASTSSGDCNEPKASLVEGSEPQASSVEGSEPYEVENTANANDEPVTDPYHYTKGGEFTSEVFKIEIRNLPRYFGFSQLKKQLNKLKLNPKKLKAMKGNNGNFGFVTFNCEEDKQKALKTLDGYVWKKARLIAVSAKPVADPIARNALKRKQEENKPKRSHETEEAASKRRKQEEEDKGPIGHRLNDAVTPLWRESYDDQLKMKDADMKEFLRQLTRKTKTDIGMGMLKVMNPDYFKNFKDDMCCPIEAIKPSPVLNGYRNKCEFTVGTSLDGEQKTVGFRLGSYRGGQIAVVDPSECLHLSPQTKNVVKCFQKYIRELSSLSAHDPVTHSGHWRMLTVRTNTRGDIMAIVVMHPHQLTKEELETEKQQLRDFFQSGDGKEAVVSSVFMLQQTSSSRGEDDSTQECDLVYGEPHITEEILGLSFRISPDAFFQVNSQAAEVLYRTIADFADVNEKSTVLDICCGTGTIGISIAKRVNQVIGIEVNKQAIQDAIYNAEKNGLTNVSYKCGKAEDVMPSITNNLKSSKDIIGIVDPPRAGLAFKVLQAIRRCDNLRRLVYVSCNPYNAMSNFIDLCRPVSNKHKGTPFYPVKAVPVDLFPHTKHCELVILFERDLRDVGHVSSKEGATAVVEGAGIEKMDIGEGTSESANNEVAVAIGEAVAVKVEKDENAVAIGEAVAVKVEKDENAVAIGEAVAVKVEKDENAVAIAEAIAVKVEKDENAVAIEEAVAVKVEKDENGE